MMLYQNRFLKMTKSHLFDKIGVHIHDFLFGHFGQLRCVFLFFGQTIVQRMKLRISFDNRVAVMTSYRGREEGKRRGERE